MSGLLPRSENQATNIVPSRARSTLGSSSLVGLPVESRRGSVGWNVGAFDVGAVVVSDPAQAHRPASATAAATRFRPPPSLRVLVRAQQVERDVRLLPHHP